MTEDGKVGFFMSCTLPTQQVGFYALDVLSWTYPFEHLNIVVAIPWNSTPCVLIRLRLIAVRERVPVSLYTIVEAVSRPCMPRESSPNLAGNHCS